MCVMRGDVNKAHHRRKRHAPLFKRNRFLISELSPWMDRSNGGIDQLYKSENNKKLGSLFILRGSNKKNDERRLRCHCSDSSLSLSLSLCGNEWYMSFEL